MPDEADTALLVGQPARLAHTDYFAPRASLSIYHQFVYAPVAIHWHEFYEMHLVLAGEGTHVLNGAVYPLARGSFFLLTPADFHALDSRPGAPLEIFNVIFADEALTEELRELMFGGLAQYRATLTGAALDDMAAECHRLWTEVQDQRTGYRLVMRSALERILVGAVRSTSARGPAAMPRPSDPRRKIGRALTYIHHHFREPLTLAQAAGEARLSPHYFSECFHAATGIAFQQYLRELRLRFAHSLLAVTDASISDLCLASGFSSLSNFERAFKARYRLSPRAYRAARRAR